MHNVFTPYTKKLEFEDGSVLGDVWVEDGSELRLFIDEDGSALTDWIGSQLFF